MKAIITLAQALGLVVIAEGVENLYQLELLRKIGCQRVQGYYFSKPLPSRLLEAYFSELGELQHN